MITMFSLTAANAKVAPTTVGMGEIAGGDKRQQMRAVVGSCIALTLYNARLRIGVMAHVVLPDSSGRYDAPGKYADTAIPRMLEMFRKSGAPPQSLVAKFAGGANMFDSRGPLQIGDANVKAVTQALKAAGVTVADCDIGGLHGRRVTFDCANGMMTVEAAGQPARTF
jgi:chemotaxis protein CheD